LKQQVVEGMGNHNYGLVILAVLAAGFLMPGTGAVFPGGHETGPIVTAPNLNVSGIDGANSTIPAGFQTHPVPVRVEVTISETLIPGPKGEMQAGPRTIGFSADPILIAILAVAIITGAAGVWYLARRRPEEPDKIAEEEEK
jgi:hypothetical protein